VPGVRPSHLHNMIEFTLKYHEAIFVLHQKSVIQGASRLLSMNTEAKHRREACVQSAQSVLSLTHLFECEGPSLTL
jgi:hypothetical protein